MPVIGRLDSQVNDVLIEPVGKRRERAERETADDARSAATGGTSRDDAEGANDAAHDDSRDAARSDEQLPVWLL